MLPVHADTFLFQEQKYACEGFRVFFKPASESSTL